MKLNKDKKILIVGLGLIGGSYAMALTKKGYRVGAITRSESSIEYALSMGLIDYGTTEIDKDIIGEADLIIFCLYPNVFYEWIKNNQQYFKPGAVITDVTGIKVNIVYKIQEILRPDVEFIPSHPMAGREVYGVKNADDRIFKGANFIVTPTSKNTPDAIELCRNLGEELGFYRISELTPEKHDDMIGFLSQLTHCIAITLMTCNNVEHLQDYTGDSFRDLTRIARINEDMWTELFLLNRDQLLKHISQFEVELDKLKIALNQNDEETIKDIMRKSTERRALFDKKEN
ncbi:MAG: prephenate dehydrogenase [Clostridia bacterium]|nr:prephenate dehydrogenase [Clostridia bacterium]